MAADSPPVPLKEFCPLYYLLNAIPAKVQKGFRSVLVYLTALDASSDYIAVGSSIGMLYLYCRRLNQMKKYNLEGKSESITAVKLLSCFDDLVAVGTALGRVVLFQLVCPLPGRNKQLRRFDVVGLHKRLSIERPCARAVKVDCPCPLSQIASRDNVVWALTEQRAVFCREGLSSFCTEGERWKYDSVSERQGLEPVCISLGDHHTAWALDTNGNLWFRTGVTPKKPQGEDDHWWQPVGMHLVSVHSSPNDRMLWAVDSKGNVHVRTGITEDMPVGTDWEHIPGLQAGELAVSSRTVWVRCPNGDVARRYGITDKNPAGDYWKKVPGCVACLTVTPLDELWAISQSGGLIQRLTKSFQHDRSSAEPSGSAVCVQSEDLEEEWEVI
ncbi:UNVERIFIED_CONTAM: hypothetical protein FKN15_011858 [Acipenser sinensis]